MEKIYLNIAGFNFLLILKDIQQRYYQEEFKKMILNKYPNFIVKSNNKIDFKLIADYKGSVDVYVSEHEDKIRRVFTNDYSIDGARKKATVNYTVSQLQFDMIIKEIIDRYLFKKNKGFYLHGSAVGKNNKAFLFLGKSGAGKSTTAQLLGGLCKVLSDDFLIVRKNKKDFSYYQSISYEKNWDFKRTNDPYQISKIFFVKKAGDFSLEKIENKSKALSMVMKQFFTFDSKLDIQFPLLTEFVNNSEFYYIYVKKDEKLFKDFFKKRVLKV